MLLVCLVCGHNCAVMLSDGLNSYTAAYTAARAAWRGCRRRGWRRLSIQGRAAYWQPRRRQSVRAVQIKYPVDHLAERYQFDAVGDRADGGVYNKTHTAPALCPSPCRRKRGRKRAGNSLWPVVALRPSETHANFGCFVAGEDFQQPHAEFETGLTNFARCFGGTDFFVNSISAVKLLPAAASNASDTYAPSLYTQFCANCTATYSCSVVSLCTTRCCTKGFQPAGMVEAADGQRGVDQV